MPIDHSTIHVREDTYNESLNLYIEALKPLGYEKQMQFGPTIAGLGVKDHGIPSYTHTDFWVMGAKDGPNHTTHLAFRANDRAAVDAFHAAALKAGAKDNGTPGPRPHYHAHYYAAFVLDLVGNNIEAVCHDAPQ